MSEEQEITYGGADKIHPQLRAQEMYLTYGYLGRIFGSPKHSPLNVAGLVLLLLIATLLYIVMSKDPTVASELFKLIIPVITLTLGFMFGRSSNN